MSDREKELKNWIITDLEDMDVRRLAKVFDFMQSMSNSPNDSNLKAFRNIAFEKDKIINEFIESNCFNNAESTKNVYSLVLKDFLNTCTYPININTIHNFIKSKNWKQNTKNRNLIVLRMFLKFLFSNGYIIQDLSLDIQIPKKAETIEYCPTYNQIELFFNAVKKVFKDDNEKFMYDTLFKIYIMTGCRKMELLKLNVEDLDFDSRTILLRKTKSGNEQRIIIDEKLENIIKKYLNHFNYKNGPLFKGKMGKRLCRQTLALKFKKMKDASKLPRGLKIHTMRHYFIDSLCHSGIPMHVVKELARHKDIRTTERYCSIHDGEMLSALSSIRVPA